MEIKTREISDDEYYYNNIVNKTFNLIVHDDYQDEKILHDDITLLAIYLANAISYAIHHNLEILCAVGYLTPINIIINKMSSFDVDYFVDDDGRLMLNITDSFKHLEFGIDYDDFISLKDMIINMLSEEDQAYLLLNNIDIANFFNEADEYIERVNGES